MGKIERANWLGSLACNTQREKEMERGNERERLHWQSQLQLQLESDSDLEADSEWASWTWLGLARLGVWLCLACGGKFHCHASFSINLLATAGQADKSNEPPQAAGSVCRMPHATARHCHCYTNLLLPLFRRFYFDL